VSFDTGLEIAVVEGEAPDLETVRSKVLAQLDRDGIHHDVFSDLSEAFGSGRGHFRVHPLYLLQLLDAVARILPNVSFDARALGEQFRETWIAEYRAGSRLYTQGPWDYE
jgi:hypothetical protein